MLIDSYPVEDGFARVLEVAAQTDPVLTTLDTLLEDDQLYQAVRTDLGKRYRLTLAHGRHSTPVEVILRLLLVKHLYSWSYEETTKRVADSLVLRWFCRAYVQTAPTKATPIRWTHTLRPETLHELNDRVVELAVQAKVTEGRKLRLDATCVQTEIRHPTDSGLLVDSVRVLSCVVQRAKGLIQEQVRNAQQPAAPFTTANGAAGCSNLASPAETQRRGKRSPAERVVSEADQDSGADDQTDQTVGVLLEVIALARLWL